MGKSQNQPTITTTSPAQLRILVALVAILVAIAVTAALKAASTVFIPLVIALFLVYLISPLMIGLQKLRVPDALTIPVIVLLLLVFLLLFYLVIYSTVNELSEQVPNYILRIERILDGLLDLLGSHAYMITDMSWLGTVSEAISSTTMTFFGSVVTFVANLVLVLMYTGFILAGRRALAVRLGQAFSAERATSISHTLTEINDAIRRYIVAKTLISFVTGSLVFLALLIFGVDFALFWGVLAFLLNFIPAVGSIIACLFPILLALVQFDNPWMALWIGIVLIVIQQVMGSLVEPLFLGSHLNISPLVVLFSLVFFGWLWGFWGMVLSIPLTSVTKIAMEQTLALKPFAIMLESDWAIKNQDNAK